MSLARTEDLSARDLRAAVVLGQLVGIGPVDRGARLGLAVETILDSGRESGNFNQPCYIVPAQWWESKALGRRGSVRIWTQDSPG